MFPKANSLKDLLIHLAIMAGILIAILLVFFYLWLPYTTHHGETITVPTLKGMQADQLDDFLSERNLRYEINDSTYIPGTKPNTVILQHPSEGSKVKENRKIYITIAAKNPPKVKMPNLVDHSLRSAEMELKGFDLVKGKVTMVPSPYHNLVIRQLVNGKEVLAGSYIPKGTIVDLQVGSGAGGAEIELPNLVGMDLVTAKAKLAELGLGMGSEIPEVASEEVPGTVVKQRPEATAKIHKGEMVDLWVVPAE
jgi:beta-lactam-binding protein with PASTA domain